MRRVSLVFIVSILLGGMGTVSWGVLQGINSLSASPTSPRQATVVEAMEGLPAVVVVSGTTTTVVTPTTPEIPTTPEPTTTLPFIDYPNPVHLSVPSLGIEADIDWTGPDFDSRRFEPRSGYLDWWSDSVPVEPTVGPSVGPCEIGSSFILGHNPGLFRDLVDDPDPEADDDAGLAVGEMVLVVLEDGTVCEYTVVPFESDFGEVLEGTPARRFLKDTWAGEDWDHVIAETGTEESTLFLLTSGGREDEYELVNGRLHKPLLDVIKLVLSSIDEASASAS